MGDVDPRTCPTCVNRVKREEPSKVTFDLIFIYFDSWLSVGKISHHTWEVQQGGAPWKYW